MKNVSWSKIHTICFVTVGAIATIFLIQMVIGLQLQEYDSDLFIFGYSFVLIAMALGLAKYFIWNARYEAKYYISDKKFRDENK